ncbi:nuclease-related domain-containing protein [Curtobacterium sp. MCBD17_040]|uniref:nuclease-related domain-containing protein n=1 Tax=Curtobacterium sp. MCBD17_040 TaxID=2175674 RepID=UPI0024DF8AA8|nr:nuclease-related domain-containing protein [Curtobacterium sp. MCBD17_040]WIB65691.1 nuclease-related domain-containing protein [Curtobacterium sp. MCBD17_040]
MNHSESWLADQGTAKVGAKGEQRTGQLLNALATTGDGPTVLHDLRIPIPGVKANIDHIVVSGSQVTIVDSKVWKPGFYWTLFGATRRGLELFPPADKQTMPMAVDAVRTYLRKQNLRGSVATPLLVVWSSQKSKPTSSLTFLHSPGARAVNGSVFAAAPARYVGGKPADEQIVRALAQLLLRP